MSSPDRITLEHGGGGTAMLELLAATVLKEFKLKKAGLVGLDELDDGAALSVGGNTIVFTTDSHTVSPLFFPGGDIGRLAVAGTVNDLAVMGGKPLAMASAMVVEEGFEMEKFKQVIRSMASTAEEAGVALVTGDFKVVEHGELDRLIITTTGVGVADSLRTDQMLRPGDKIIINGPVGNHGATILACRKGLEMTGELRSDVAPLWSLVEASLSVGGVSAMKDPTRGGLAGAINEMASKSGVEVVLWEERIPVDEEVRAFCEMLGLDPLYLTNEGKIVMGVSSEMAEDVLRAIRSTPYGSHAAIIGEVREGTGERVVVETFIGGKRKLPPPVGDPVPRIC